MSTENNMNKFWSRTDNVPYRYRRVTPKSLDNYTAGITPRMYGAVGNKEHDDTEALQTCIYNHGFCEIPAGKYIVSGTIHVPSNKHIRFSKDAWIVPAPNWIDSNDKEHTFISEPFDIISIDGGNICIENLNIDEQNLFNYKNTTKDVPEGKTLSELILSESYPKFEEDGKTPYKAHCAVIFPAGKQNDNVTLTDPCIMGWRYNHIKKHDTDGEDLLNELTTAEEGLRVDTDPYTSFISQYYPRGIGVRIHKDGTPCGDNGGDYAQDIRIVRPRIDGFSCALQVCGSGKGWINDCHFTDFWLQRSGNFLQVSPRCIERCKFSGTIQCQPVTKQSYWSIYGGDACHYDIMYWDTNRSCFFVPSAARPFINCREYSRFMNVDFGGSILLNCDRVDSDVQYSRGVWDSSKNHAVRLDPNNRNQYELSVSLKNGESTSSSYLLFKDGSGNYLLPGNRLPKSVSFDVVADDKFKYWPFIRPLTEFFEDYSTRTIYQPTATVTTATPQFFTDTVNGKDVSVLADESEITVDNAEGLEVGDCIVIWGGTDGHYGYHLAPQKAAMFTDVYWVFSIKSKEGNKLTLTSMSKKKQKVNYETTFTKTETDRDTGEEVTYYLVHPDVSEAVGCRVSKVYNNPKHTDKIDGLDSNIYMGEPIPLTTYGERKRVRVEYGIEDFDKLIKSKYLSVGIMISMNGLDTVKNISKIKLSNIEINYKE